MRWSHLTKPISVLRVALRAIWRRKARSAGIAAGVLLLFYGTTYALVASAESPTDRIVHLSDDGESARRMACQVVREANSPLAPRIILIHGAPADASSWGKLLREADALDPPLPDCEIIAIDRLGYGNASPEVCTSLAEHAAALRPLLDMNVDGDERSDTAQVSDAQVGDGVLGDGANAGEAARPAILIGHSYGGPVALQAAADFPDRVAGVILVAGATDPNMNDAVTVRKALAALGPMLPRPWAHANRELLALTAENRALEPRLADIECPVAFIHGEWDPVCPHDATRDYLNASLTNAAELRIVSLPRAGHNLHLSHPDVILAELRRQLDALNGARMSGDSLAAR